MSDSLADGGATLVSLDFFAATPVPGCEFYYVSIRFSCIRSMTVDMAGHFSAAQTCSSQLAGC